MARQWSRRASRVRERDELAALSAGAVALVALVVGRAYGKLHHSSANQKITVWIAAGVLLIFGVIAFRRLATLLGRLVTHRQSASTGGTVRFLVSGVGLVVMVFGVLTVLGVSAGQLLLGAGVAGVVLGIAAQQSLGNVFAALVLVLARPFKVGDHIRLHSGSIGLIDVWVLEIGLTYITVRTDDGVLKIPNSAMLAAGIGQLTGQEGSEAPPEPHTPS